MADHQTEQGGVTRMETVVEGEFEWYGSDSSDSRDNDMGSARPSEVDNRATTTGFSTPGEPGLRSDDGITDDIEEGQRDRAPGSDLVSMPLDGALSGVEPSGDSRPLAERTSGNGEQSVFGPTVGDNGEDSDAVMV